MTTLFLHQNFPGQFVHIAAAIAPLCSRQLLAVTSASNRRPAIIPAHHYHWQPSSTATDAGFGSHYAICAARGAAVADALTALKTKRYTPDLIVGHGGWGQTVFVREVWPDVPLLLHAEFFYRGLGLDVGFDPPTSPPDLTRTTRLARARSVVMLQALADATHGVTPTYWCENVTEDDKVQVRGRDFHRPMH